MPHVRVYYDEASGEVREIEHRADEQYDEENLRARTEGIATIVAEGSGLANVPFHRLQVKNGRLSRRRGTKVAEPEFAIARLEDGELGVEIPPPDEATQRRVEEILQIDKSELSEEEWLKLYREYTTLTGRF
jgi:hypothetical protein